MKSSNPSNSQTKSLQDNKFYIPAIGFLITASETDQQRPNQLPDLPREVYILPLQNMRIIRTGKEIIRNLGKQMFGVFGSEVYLGIYGDTATGSYETGP